MGKFIDLAGQKFGRLTVIERAPNVGTGATWICLCDCGTKKTVRSQHLLRSGTQSCGCLVKDDADKKTKDLSGRTFGRWIVLNKSPVRRNGCVCWECKCSCGVVKVVPGTALRNGASTSCGCFARELSGQRLRAHGKARDELYGTWYRMMQRCENPQDRAYKHYGARGISVCDRWRESVDNFISDMTPRPKGTSLDRIDNTRGYSPDNCRWATDVEQARNRRSNHLIQHNGCTTTLQEWSELIGISTSTIRHRLKRGWPAERALTTPVGVR